MILFKLLIRQNNNSIRLATCKNFQGQVLRQPNPTSKQGQMSLPNPLERWNEIDIVVNKASKAKHCWFHVSTLTRFKTYTHCYTPYFTTSRKHFLDNFCSIFIIYFYKNLSCLYFYQTQKIIFSVMNGGRLNVAFLVPLLDRRLDFVQKLAS